MRFKTLGEKMKKTIIAAIVVLVVVIAAVGIYFTVLDKDDKDKNEITFLIEDDQGVYFWIKGTGETAKDAFIDAAEKSSIDYDHSVGSGLVLTKINNLANSSSLKWTLFVYDDGKWTKTSDDMAVIVSENHDYLAWFFVNNNGDLPDDLPDVKDAKVWNKDSTSGTVFTIASQSGLYFRINGVSDVSLIKAFNNACANYKVPLVNSHHDMGEGIDELFGYGWDSVSGKFWAQYHIENGAWETSQLGMSSLLSKDHSKYLVYFSLYGDHPTIPI